MNYVTNNLNQYTSVGGVAYSYDDDGNLTYDGNNTYTYGAENRLMTASRTGVSVSYQYDAFGRRIQKTIASDETRVTGYVYDGDQVICEYGTSGKLVRKFLYGTGIDEAVRMTNVLPSADIAQNGIVDFIDVAVFAKVWLFDINDPGFDPNADLVADDVIDLEDLAALTEKWLTDGHRGEDYFYYYDSLGSVIALTDSTGNTVETYNYDVYGRINSTSSVGNPYLFTGRRYDAEIGLYYYRVRYYSPEVGRFLQTDPVGYYDSANLYSYCINNPIMFTDPFGLWYIDINVSGGYWGGLTGGIMISPSGVYWYIGGGVVTPGVGVAVTWSPMDVSTGWNIGLQGQFGIAGQVGYSFADNGGGFGEIGGGWPPGASLTGYYVFEWISFSDNKTSK